MTEIETERKPRNWKMIGIIAGVVVVIGLIGSLFQDDDETEPAAAADQAADTDTEPEPEEPADEPEPEAEPEIEEFWSKHEFGDGLVVKGAIDDARDAGDCQTMQEIFDTWADIAEDLPEAWESADFPLGVMNYADNTMRDAGCYDD